MAHPTQADVDRWTGDERRAYVEQLRRRAAALGLIVSKSRARKPDHPSYGVWEVSDAKTHLQIATVRIDGLAQLLENGRTDG